MPRQYIVIRETMSTPVTSLSSEHTLVILCFIYNSTHKSKTYAYLYLQDLGNRTRSVNSRTQLIGHIQPPNTIQTPDTPNSVRILYLLEERQHKISMYNNSKNLKHNNNINFEFILSPYGSNECVACISYRWQI